MQSEIKVIHEELLVLLEKFHEICIENGIKYSLHGGTLLGAIREGGFIQWDDDADITMDRVNYDSFCVLMEHINLSDEFAFANDTRFPQFIMKREGRPVVWTDIFVYDYISENSIIQKIKMLGTKFFILITRSLEDQKMSNMNGLYKGVSKVVINVLVYVSHIVPYKTRLSLARNFMKMFPGNKTLVHRSNDTRVGMSLILPASINTSYVNVQFEGKMFMIVENYNAVLISSYGSNYMIPRRDKPDKMHAITLKREQEIMEQHIIRKRAEIDG